MNQIKLLIQFTYDQLTINLNIIMDSLEEFSKRNQSILTPATEWGEDRGPKQNQVQLFFTIQELK